MRNNRKKFKNSGITLIALVVTIVVLLILAGVTLNLVIGNNGIINKAQDAKIATRAGGAEDEVKMWKNDNYIGKSTNGTTTSKEEMLQSLKNKNLVYEEEIDRENEVIIIKGKNGAVVKEIPYGETIIYTYTEDGYITGIKDEYFKNPESANKEVRLASTTEIKLADMATVETRSLVDELNNTLVIPNEIKGTKIIGISERAFRAIGNLDKVIISEGIESIENYSFACCYSLDYVEMPDTLISIGDNAFLDCIDLLNIKIPEKVTKIGEYCFHHTEIRDNIYIPISVMEIGEYAFSSVAFEGGTINCAATSKPEKWAEHWYCGRYGNGTIGESNVNWGVSR